MDVSSLPDDPQQLKAMLLKMDSARQQELDLLRRQQSEHQQAVNEYQQQLGSQAREYQLKLAGKDQQLQEKDEKLEEYRQIIAWLRRKMFGPRSEKINDNQLLLFGQSIMPLTSPRPEPMPAEVKINRRSSHGRRIIPADLPRETVVIDIDESEKCCPDCGTTRQRIGEVISEQLDFCPPKLFARQFIQVKYACRCCQGNVVLAEKPQQVVEKGLAGPGLIAHIATGKYADHLPLYRLEGIFARYGIEISRSTMCDWMADVARLARPLVALMRQRILSSKVINSDDTPVPVQDVGKTRKGRLWIYMGDPQAPYNVFEYTPDRKGEHPQKWLERYGGYLQVDAYGGYDGLFLNEQAKEVGCWAHARRKFFDAKDKAPDVCREAIAHIARLYQVESEARDVSEDQRLLLRQEKSVPILGEIEQWLKDTQRTMLPKNPVAEAIGYALNQWKALKRYTEAGFLAIDNNAAERELRPVAIGRKNWLFAGSDEGGRTAATIYSLIRSAARHELNVEYYLRSVLAHLPGTKLSELPHLLPDVWKRELAEETANSPEPVRK
jgi:transposase